MREPRRETQVFIVSFCLSLVILGSVLLLTLFVFRLTDGRESSGKDAAALPGLLVYFLFLFLLFGHIEPPWQTFFLFRILYHN